MQLGPLILYNFFDNLRLSVIAFQHSFYAELKVLLFQGYVIFNVHFNINSFNF